MNIAFDAKRAFLNQSGLGNYSRTLIKSSIKYFPDNHYTLFTPSVNPTPFFKYVSGQKNVSIVQPKGLLNKVFKSYWRSYGITKELRGINCYHGLSNELPFNINEYKGKKIVTVHDLIFLRYPEYYPAADRKIYDSKFKAACDKADVIVAVSEQTKRDIERFYFVSSQKIKVIYQACDEIFYRESSSADSGRVKLKYNLPVEYLLHVGTIEERKNLLTILKALLLVDDIPLVVVGRKRDYFRRAEEFVQKNNLSKRVIFTENVLTADLPDIYQGAKAFIYPSEFEGFGIPIIEALTSKVPVITSNEEVFAEAGGPDSIYIDAHNNEELSAEIKKLLAYPELCKQMAERGVEYAKKFEPKEAASEIIKLYSEQ
jgi:glycosyltransferase involved in cell wall biosynthesis